MRRLTYPAALLFLTCLVYACDFRLASRPTTPDAANTITVAEGGVVPLPDGEASLRFARKLEESRCPRGAECVQAGEARIKLELISGEQDSLEFTLVIAGFVNKDTKDGHQTQQIGEYKFTLVELSPYPDARRPGTGGRSAAMIRLVRVRES